MATRDKPLKDLVGVWPIFGYKFWIQILHSDLERGVLGFLTIMILRFFKGPTEEKKTTGSNQNRQNPKKE